MLIRLTELLQTDGFYENAQRQVAIDPTSIDSVKPARLADFAGPCCELRVIGEESPLFVPGDLDAVLAVVQSAEESALEKLAAICAILRIPDETPIPAP